MTCHIRPFDSSIIADNFHCACQPLDDYIRFYASQDVRKNVARVFIAVPEKDPQHLAGSYTLSAGSVSCSSLPPTLARKLPRYPVPVALIGRLATDRNFQGKGLGSILLADACQKVSQASRVLAVAGSLLMPPRMMKSPHFMSTLVSSDFKGKLIRCCCQLRCFSQRSVQSTN